MEEQHNVDQNAGINAPGFNPQQNAAPTHQQQQQAHGVPPHFSPSRGLNFQQPVGTDAIILQILQQLRQQQAVTNQLLQQQNESSQQQQGYMQQHELLLRNAMSSIQVNVPPNPEVILDSLAANIKEFLYDPENHSTFAAWFSRYEDLFAKDAARIDDEAKVRLLLRRLGTNEHYRYISFILPRSPKDFTFTETINKLKALFGIRESAVKRRYSTLTVTKTSVEDYITFGCRVNKMCVEFELSKLSEEQFKCLIFVCGLKLECDSEIRTRLLTKIEDNSDVRLESLMEECQRLINLKSDTAMIESVGNHVHAIKGNPMYRRHPRRQQFTDRPKHHPTRTPNKTAPKTPCWNCGGMHYSKYCKFRNQRCTDCKQLGHKEGYCSSAKRSSPKPSQRNEKHFTNTITLSVDCVRGKRRYVWVKINGIATRLQLDTASDITIISEEVWRHIGEPRGIPTKQKAKSATGEQLPLLFEFNCEVSINELTCSGQIYVSKTSLNLLGIDLIDKLGLWSSPMDNFCNYISDNMVETSSLRKVFPKLFSDTLGMCTKTKIKLTLKEASRPVFRPKRPVSYAMLATVDEELNRLEQFKIISAVDYSEWAAPIVVVRKASGSIRICGDYSTGLNHCLQSHQYPLPLPEDIFSKLSNCNIFSQIDLTDAFLQMEVDESSRKLLTINTHRGLYQYNRLPPGIKSAPGAFQQLIDTMLAGLPSCAGYLDDVIVGGKNTQEHQHNLFAVLQRIQDYGFTIRPEKCSFGQKQIRYLGHLLDKQGLRPDPEKIKSIKNMPAPKDITSVRSFMGAINYYGKFVHNMRNLRFPLDNLLKTGSTFKWTSECQKAFEKFKEILSSDLLLTHYDPTQEIIVSADASSIGIGATISHKFPDGKLKVIQHASRALTETEQRYSQIDREGLAIIYAVTKFHKFIFGRQFRIQTDHAPLLRIFGSKKGIPVYTANRLQRWALTLLSYDFTIEYVSTDKFGNADVLSRLIDQQIKPDEDFVVACASLEEDLKSIAINSTSKLPLSFSMVKEQTRTDPTFYKLYRFIQNGWPETRSQIKNPEMQRYYDRKDSLSIVQGCIMFSDRLVIPTAFRKRCLLQLHKGHPGIQRMKSIARSYVYWPGIDEDICSYVKTCHCCSLAARSPQKATPESWSKTTLPWQRIHIDFAGPLEDTFYLIVVDAHSKWPEIFPTRRITTGETIRLLRTLFANKGMPETLVSDNGTQFKSADFEQFCMENGINHITTAPFHPQSNGQAERFVDSFKRAIKKIEEGEGNIKQVLDTFLLTYRTTPNPNVPGGKSPAEVMYNRPIRTSLDLLRVPAYSEPSEIQDFNRSRSFKSNDLVYAKVYANNKWRWAIGTVMERLGHVMYNVWVDNRKMIRSHINQLRSRTMARTTTNKQVNRSSLPLSVLLDEWALSKSTSIPNNTTAETTGDALETNSQKILQPHKLPSLSVTGSTSPGSTSSTSTDFQSAAESSPAVQIPRRSSRNRRPPQRFQSYHRY